MKAKTNLYHRWLLKYFFQMAISLGIIVIVYLVGYIVCKRRIWYPDDAWYCDLNWIDDHTSVVIFFLMLVCSVFFAVRMLKKIAFGVSEIGDAIVEIDSEKKDPIVLPTELAHIEQLMNQVRIQNAANIQSAREANQRKNDMIMYMAHDLKTPLTSVIGYLTLVSEEPDIPENARGKYIGIALKKAQRLEELINEFFDITRFNFTQMILEKSSVNLSVMLKQMVTEFEPIFREKNLNTTLEIEDGIEYLCDVDKMERVFDNLFKNIVNYSYPDTAIVICLHQCETDRIELITTNHGKTIPKEMIAHIFDQFFRMDSSRNSDTGGSGLGLAVTKEIISLHGGTIRCESENEQISFRITLPLNL